MNEADRIFQGANSTGENMAKRKRSKYVYEITIYELLEGNRLGEKKFQTERKITLTPPYRDATTYGKPIKFRSQRGWSVVELAPDERGRKEIVFYRRKGSGKNPRLFERFWKNS